MKKVLTPVYGDRPLPGLPPSLRCRRTLLFVDAPAADIGFIKLSKSMQKLSASSTWSTWRPLSLRLDHFRGRPSSDSFDFDANFVDHRMLLKLVNYIPPAWGSPAWEAPCLGMPLQPKAGDGTPSSEGIRSENLSQDDVCFYSVGPAVPFQKSSPSEGERSFDLA